MQKALLLSSVATVFFLSASIGKAAVVIQIDVSDPSAVVISAVANNSSVTANAATDFSRGISFVDIFASNEDLTSAASVSGDWTASGATESYNEMVTFDFSDTSGNVVAGDDISIYYNVLSSGGTQSFSTSAVPFSGSSTVDWSGISGLPLSGATGDVYVGWQATHGGVIGQWEIISSIPEPTTMGLWLILLSAGFVANRRRCV